MANDLIEIKDEYGKRSNIMVIDNIVKLDCEEYDLYNPKDFDKYIDACEKSVRQSMEYNEFILYLRNYMDMNRCAIFNNVSNAESTKIKIELHHHPISLATIVKTIYNKRCFYKESLEVELVAKEAMYIHYFLYIGLIPLAKSAHTGFHNGIVCIPIDKVLGKYEEFINQYGEWIPPENMETIKEFESITSIIADERNRQLFQVAPTYLKIDGGDIGTYKLPKLQEVLSIMTDNLAELEDRSPKGILIDPYYMDPGESEDNKIKTADGKIRPFIILDK